MYFTLVSSQSTFFHKIVIEVYAIFVKMFKIILPIRYFKFLRHRDTGPNCYFGTLSCDSDLVTFRPLTRVKK